MAERVGRVGGVVASVPTLLVLAALGGVAWWGHRTGWKAPKFSQVAGASAAAAPEDWCGEHNVPESRCVACNPQLRGANPKDWCAEHGLPESRCTICNPDLLDKGVAADWCDEHGVPESNCTICHPEPAAATAVATGTPAEGAADACCPHEQAATTPGQTAAHEDEHDHAQQGDQPVAATHDGHDHEQGDHASKPAETVERDAHAEHEHTAAAPADNDVHAGHNHAPAGPKDPKTCQVHNRRVQLASDAALGKIGIELARVEQQPVTQVLTGNAEVNYNRFRVAQISPKVAGTVWRVEKEIGDPVAKGEVLALLDAAEVGRAKAELLAAAAALDMKAWNFQWIQTSANSGVRAQAELQTAQAELKDARVRHFNARQGLINLGLLPPDNRADLDEQAIQFLGLPDSIVRTLDAETTTANLLPLTAPFDGVVTERQAVTGEVVEAGKPLFVIADTRVMWLTIDLPIEQIDRVTLGQEVRFQVDRRQQHAAAGRIAWISTAVDERTRTVKLRADLDNPDGRLLANTFGKAHIQMRQAAQAAVVPSEAVQWEGCCHVVFVQVAADQFQPRKVRLGVRDPERTEVLVGLRPGETIAAAGSHVLKSELLKGNLGDTCGGH